MKKYFIKECKFENICGWGVYKRRFFGLFKPKYLSWFYIKSHAEKHIEYIKNL